MSGCKPEEPTQQLAMSISICLPAGEVYPAQAPELRAFGDPGTTEQFALPTHVYIYIVKDDKVWDIIEKTPSSSDWTKKHYVGPYDTEKDSIYVYTPEDLNLLLESGSFNGRIYIYASAVQLTPSPVITTGSDLADLLNLKFSFDGTLQDDPTSIVNNLQNIYSTPYNYQPDGEHYYGSFYATQKVPHLNLLLYHVAAKVDLMWNVKENLREDVKISYIAAENLYDGPCYIFKPTANQPTNEYLDENHVYTGGYTKTVLDSKKNESPAPSPGTQWNGRGYFYAIPYKNNDVDGESNPDPHYPLQLTLCKDSDRPDGGSYYSTIVKTDIPEIWTSWIRGQISINTATYNVTP